MNCAYHIHNAAVVNCNGCGKPLCAACDHRIKGFPFCQDCIVSGIELLRQHNQSSYAPFVKRQTSPLIATILSAVCPGLGAAYNGQTSKALIYFAVFVGLFQMAVLTGMAIFVLGFLGMWVFAAVDAWRTAHIIRSGVTPDDAQDILVQRFSGNPKAWGIVLTVLGVSFFLQTFFGLKSLTKFVLPFLLIGLGVYLLREYIFKKKVSAPDWSDYPARTETPQFVSALTETNYRANETDYETKTRVRNWKNR
ncbi:hypothetical protein BH20ACI4_BH20ACI4_28620 [soil metagenome]